MEPTADLYIAYVALFSLALIPIWFGSIKSLSPSQVVESLATKDAILFPFIGSAVLFSLYLLFKYLAKEWINFLMSTYFMFIGIGAMAAVLTPVLNHILPYQSYVQRKPYHFGKLPWYLSWIHSDPIELQIVHIISIGVASIFGVFYLATKHWVLNNIIGLSFCVLSIELISLGSFTKGCILLVGLFFYDVFWVFGTEVMVTVAKNFDAPIKLLWPRFNAITQTTQFSLLGLGDIVIPGIFIALMLRFDLYLFKQKNPSATHKSKFTRTYFYSCLVGYMLGLACTMLVLHIFKAGQPALLYIVPGCIGSVLFTAFKNGQFADLMAYKDPEIVNEHSKST